MPEHVELIETCVGCGLEFTVEYWADDFEEFKRGKLLGEAMPYLTSDERTLLLCRLCSKCYLKELRA